MQRGSRQPSWTTGNECEHHNTASLHCIHSHELDTASRDGSRFAGTYYLDESTGAVTGNPASTVEIAELVRVIQTKAIAEGANATRRHAEAITIEDMKALIQWSELVCPNEEVENCTKPEGGCKDPTRLKLLLTHAMMRAFCTSGFTLWTRFSCSFHYTMTT